MIGDIDLWYTVPVCVEVRDGQVSKVVVIDEELTPNAKYAASPGQAKQIDEGYDAVEKMMWPAWQFGW